MPTETVPTRYRGTFEVCAGAPFPPAEVEVSWTGARRGAEAWLSEPAVKLLDAPDGLVVELMPNARVGGASLDPDAPWVELADLTFHCTRRQFRFPKLHEQALVGLVQLKATGEASIDGSPWKPTAPARP